MEIRESVQATPGLKILFDRLDEELPTGLKTKDLFRATTDNLAALFQAADSVGIDAQELIGETLKITITLKSTSSSEEGNLKQKNSEAILGYCKLWGTCHE